MNIKEYLNQNTNIVFILSMLGALAVIVFVSITWLLPNGSEPAETEWRCLGEDEEVSHEIVKRGRKNGLINIIINDKNNIEIESRIIIDDIRHNYRPVELHTCGIYYVKLFNYDPKQAKKENGYRSEFTKHDYSTNEKKLFILSEMKEEYHPYYSPDFRVSLSEQYVVLERGYGGSDDYALIVKDLNTKEDAFILPAQEMFEKNPNITGTLGLMEWTKDSRYFWGDKFMGAYTSGYFRIDMKNQTYELFEAPEGQMGGDQLNTETGWVTNHSGIFWTGIHEFTEQIKEEMREDGIGTKLYIYNLFTEEKILIYETDEPDWYTKPWWISDTELRYETFEGETRVYELTSE